MRLLARAAGLIGLAALFVPALSSASPDLLATLADAPSTRAHCDALAEDYLRGNPAELRERIARGMASTITTLDSEAARHLPGASADGSGPPSIAQQLQAQLMRGVDLILERLRQSPPLDQERVGTERLGSAFIRHTHVLRFEKEGWRLDCTYYRGKDGWLPRPALPSSETMGDVFSAPAPASRPGR